MSLIKKPKKEFPSVRSMFNQLWDMDDFSTDLFRQRVPSVNVSETAEDFSLEVMAPGLSRNDFNISIDNGCLTVSSEKEEKKEEKEKHYTRKEYSYNAFERTFNMPESVDKDAVSAKYKDGILTITLAKTSEAKKEQPKTIDIS